MRPKQLVPAALLGLVLTLLLPGEWSLLSLPFVLLLRLVADSVSALGSSAFAVLSGRFRQLKRLFYAVLDRLLCNHLTNSAYGGIVKESNALR